MVTASQLDNGITCGPHEAGESHTVLRNITCCITVAVLHAAALAGLPESKYEHFNAVLAAIRDGRPIPVAAPLSAPALTTAAADAPAGAAAGTAEAAGAGAAAVKPGNPVSASTVVLWNCHPGCRDM